MTDQLHTSSPLASTERADLLMALAMHRALFLRTVEGVSDEDAARRTTVSQLCLSGLVKHLAHTEQRWATFVVDGAAAMGEPGPAAFEDQAASFRLEDGETLAALVERYEEVARRTAELVAELPSLDATQALPDRPWFEPGARWSARQVFLHMVAETAQHAGHADIIREAIDGAKTMG